MADTTLNLTPQLYEYLKANSLREPEALAHVRAETQKHTRTRMQISPEQGQLMQLLIEILGARKTLDIGVFTGYSSLAVALALPPDGKVVACDINTEWTDIAKQCWEKAGVAHKIDLRIAPANDTLDLLLNNGEAGTFDFAFIDADKQNYLAYYEKSVALVRQGGLIAIDNVLWNGKVADPAINDRDTMILRQLNSRILQDDRVSISMLPISDGVTLARKR